MQLCQHRIGDNYYKNQRWAHYHWAACIWCQFHREMDGALFILNGLCFCAAHKSLIVTITWCHLSRPLTPCSSSASDEIYKHTHRPTPPHVQPPETTTRVCFYINTQVWISQTAQRQKTLSSERVESTQSQKVLRPHFVPSLGLIDNTSGLFLSVSL